MKARTITTCIAAFMGAAIASADTVNLQFVSTGAGRNVTVSLNGDSNRVFSGQLRHEFSSGTGLGEQFSGEMFTFCTELTQYVTSSSKEYRVTPPEDVSTPAMGAQKADALRNLYNFAAGQESQSGQDANYAAAFQLAVWEIVYDFDTIEGIGSLDVDDGAFEATNISNNASIEAAIRAHLSTFFSAAMTEGQPNRVLYGLWNESKQDQLIGMPMVPLPSAGLMGLAGLGVIASRRRRA